MFESIRFTGVCMQMCDVFSGRHMMFPGAELLCLRVGAADIADVVLDLVICMVLRPS